MSGPSRKHPEQQEPSPPPPPTPHKLPEPPETALPADLPETAVATPPNVSRATVEHVQYSSLFVSVFAAVAGSLVPRGLSNVSGLTEGELQYIHWAIRAAAESAQFAEETAIALKDAVRDGKKPSWPGYTFGVVGYNPPSQEPEAS